MNYNRAEHADLTGAERAIARAPDHIRRGINRIRVARGLDPVIGVQTRRQLDAAHVVLEEIARGPRDRVLGWRGRAPAPAMSKSKITRIVIVPAYGTASARSIGERWGEHIAFRAFGTADELNARAGMWQLTHGHGGAVLAAAGPQLRAVDSEIGPVLVWEPTYSDATFEVVRHMRANGGKCAASVEFRAIDRHPSRVERGAMFVYRARLDAVALLTDPRQVPAYRGAVAVMRTEQRRRDPGTLRDHIAAAVAAARAADRR